VSRCLATFVLSSALFFSIGTCSVIEGDDAVHVNRYQRNGSWEAWRTPDRDAVNCLYMLAKQCGLDCTYQDARKAFANDNPKRSLLNIRDASRALGLDASIYRCSSESLPSLRTPVIAHIEGSSSSEGTFSILLPYLRNSDPTLINGATTQLVSVNADKLLRTWDGCILKPEFHGGRGYKVSAACLFLALATTRVAHVVLRKSATCR
jgi:hypothetical protein